MASVTILTVLTKNPRSNQLEKYPHYERWNMWFYQLDKKDFWWVNYSTISFNYTKNFQTDIISIRKSEKNIQPLILLMFSSVFAVDGLPLRSSSSTDSRPLLKRSCQRKTFDLVRVSLPKHFSNISKVCAPLNPFLTQNLMQTRCCKVDEIFFFLWKIETTHKDRCTQYNVTSKNVKQCQAMKLKIWKNVNDTSTNTRKKEELKSAEQERHTVTSPKTIWSRW